MSNVKVENLSKRYGDVVAVDDISFEISSGEFVILLGESGAGKSTLLRCLNGLATPTEGTVTIGGDPVTGHRNDTATIFQQHHLITEMSAYANVLTGALQRTSLLRSVLQLHSREDKLEALDALETVGLLDEANQRTDRMSGGQQQRVGIARALVQKPGLLLADEPVASLDPATAEKVMRYLRQAAEERNLTTVASLHQVNIAREFGERFLGLRDGKLVFEGTRGDLTMDVVEEIYGDVQTEAIRQGDGDQAGGTNDTKEVDA